MVPPVASLLAYAAWLDGRGALANVALDRALAEDPAYSMALLLRDALDHGRRRGRWRPGRSAVAARAVAVVGAGGGAATAAAVAVVAAGARGRRGTRPGIGVKS